MRTRVLALAMMLTAVTLAAQTGSGVIDGGVIDERSAPVPMATVSLMAENGRLVKTVAADARGAFMFDSLADGRYTVSASKLGYVTRAYGQATESALPVVVVLAVNGRFTARVRAPRVGTMSGTIVDDNGQGISAEIQAVRLLTQHGRRAADEGTRLNTLADRLGRYRFTDIPPGDYLVSARGPDGELRRMNTDLIQRAEQSLQQRTIPLPSDDLASESTVSYLPVYYPGAINPARAAAVSVSPGEERADVNIKLLATPTLRLEGNVLTKDDKPVPFAPVRLVNPDDGSVWRSTQTNSTGDFQIAQVPTGAYALLTGGTRLDISLLKAGSSTVTVRSEPAGSLSGTVQFDGTAPRPDCRKVTCAPVLSAGAVDVRGVMDEAGPIVFSVVPVGAYTLALRSPLDGWTIGRVTLEGRDITDLPIEVGPRQDRSGLVVTFTDRPTELSGTTRVGGMAPAADVVSILAFSVDHRFWLPGSRRVRVGRPDTSGNYRFSGLPPGEYFVAVVTDFDAEAELNSTRLAALEGGATRVTVRTPEPK